MGIFKCILCILDIFLLLFYICLFYLFILYIILIECSLILYDCIVCCCGVGCWQRLLSSSRWQQQQLISCSSAAIKTSRNRKQERTLLVYFLFVSACVNRQRFLQFFFLTRILHQLINSNSSRDGEQQTCSLTLTGSLHTHTQLVTMITWSPGNHTWLTPPGG